MDLSRFGEDLKKLRVEKQVSLMDISFSTRINVKFLEAIEAGKFSVLPQTYIRAFLREYGEAIGLSGEEMMRRYDAATREPGQTPSAVQPLPPPMPSAPATSSADNHRPEFSVSPTTLVLASFLLIAIAFFLYSQFSSPKPPENTAEIPFDTVVKESEASNFRPDTVSRTIVLPPPPVVKADSLRLEIATSDSVWISVLIDGKKTLEFLFPPNRIRTLVAKDQFSITMGNAGGATFKLNGKQLGTLGRRGAVVRNVVLNEARLKNS
jgi:hypothetical protein